jgi:hypothetical protein
MGFHVPQQQATVVTQQGQTRAMLTTQQTLESGFGHSWQAWQSDCFKLLGRTELWAAQNQLHVDVLPASAATLHMMELMGAKPMKHMSAVTQAAISGVVACRGQARPEG